MKGELEIQAPSDSKASLALAFFLRAVGIGLAAWLFSHAFTAIRWW